MPEIGVRHDRKQRAAVLVDTFLNRARDFVVGPCADASLWIGRNVRRVERAQFGNRHLPARTLHAWRRRILGVFEVVITVAVKWVISPWASLTGVIVVSSLKNDPFLCRFV